MIQVSVARYDPHLNFWPHFTEWYALNKFQHSLILDVPPKRMPLHKAQLAALDRAWANRKHISHILFVEDDHWGFPPNALDLLVDAQKDIIGFHTFASRAPMESIAMRKKAPEVSLIDCKPGDLIPVEYAKGQPLVQEMDLVGFGFTLIKLDVFDRLEENPFGANSMKKPTDSFLCQYAADVGIQPYVHFGWTMPHGDVVPELRRDYNALWSKEKQIMENRKPLAADLKSPGLDVIYNQARQTRGGFGEYMDTLRGYAAQCDHVTEFGVRFGISTWSLMAARPQRLRSYDIKRLPIVDTIEDVAKKEGIDYRFYHKSSTDNHIQPTDLLFIDSLHTYNHIKTELAMQGPKVRKWIILCDTVTCGDKDENGNKPGLNKAIYEFCNDSDFEIEKVFMNNNGLTILRRNDHV
jgi:hypothetical protein